MLELENNGRVSGTSTTDVIWVSQESTHVAWLGARLLGRWEEPAPTR
jgi:hypothetical protein